MIQINEITIQAFRGISNAITLDLSAPITLIYAPNGVGKTSICDAVEWLLLDQVKRLENSGATDADYRCIHANPELETFVRGRLALDGESIVLSRNRERSRWAIGSASETSVTTSDLLQKVAPSGSEPNVHKNHANPSRQIWLRGSRFLSSDSLAALLDSSPEAVVARQRLFADLLGVGHLLEAERQLENYQKTLRPILRDSQRELDAARNDLRERQQRNSAERNSDYLTLLPAAAARLGTVRDLLGVTDSGLVIQATDVADVKRTVSLLRSELAGRKNSFEFRRQAEIRLAPDWKSRDSLALQLDADQAKAAAAVELEKDLKGEIDSSSVVVRRSEQVVSITQLRIEGIQVRQAELASSFASCIPSINSFLEVSGRRDLLVTEAFSLATSLESESVRGARMTLLRLIQDQLELRASERVGAESIQKQLEGIKIPSSEEMANLTQQYAQAERDLEKLQSDYDSVTGPTDQLRQLVTQVTSFLQYAQNCPACGHDWENPLKLRRALEEAQRGMPKALQTLFNELNSTQKLFNRLSNELHQKREALHVARELHFRLHTISENQKSFDSLLSEANLHQSPHLAADLHREMQRLDLIGWLTRLVAAISSAEQALDQTQVKEGVLETFVSSLRRKLDELQKQLQQSLEGSVKTLATQRFSLEQKRRTLQNAQLETATLKNHIEGSAARLQELRSAWADLAGTEPWTDENLASTSNQLRRERELIASCEALLDQAEQLVEESSNAEEVTRLQAKIRPLQVERDRLDSYMQSATAAQEAYRVARLDHANAQMEQLVRVISPMFNRLQSNEVYEKITVGDKAAPLSWRAISETFVMDPDTKFSQGQKQDFALSVFLARARGLGGTFFMDEPLAHLDDLNRVALLDVLRAIVLEENRSLSLVMTTANRPILRHMKEKFSRIGAVSRNGRQTPVMRVIELEGNPRVGVRASELI